MGRGKGRQMAVAAAGVLTALPEFCGKASAALGELFAKIAKIAAAESHSVTDEDAKNFRQAVKMVRKELPQFVDGAGPEAMETENGSPQDSSGNEVRTQFEIFQKGCQLFASPFEWSDGPLVQAMQNGDAILIDEINLAADAVIERLNSVLEPERTLTLSERVGRLRDRSPPRIPPLCHYESWTRLWKARVEPGSTQQIHRVLDTECPRGPRRVAVARGRPTGSINREGRPAASRRRGSSLLAGIP